MADVNDNRNHRRKGQRNRTHERRQIDADTGVDKFPGEGRSIDSDSRPNLSESIPSTPDAIIKSKPPNNGKRNQRAEANANPSSSISKSSDIESNLRLGTGHSSSDTSLHAPSSPRNATRTQNTNKTVNSTTKNKLNGINRKDDQSVSTSRLENDADLEVFDFYDMTTALPTASAGTETKERGSGRGRRQTNNTNRTRSIPEGELGHTTSNTTPSNPKSGVKKKNITSDNFQAISNKSGDINRDSSGFNQPVSLHAQFIDSISSSRSQESNHSVQQRHQQSNANSSKQPKSQNQNSKYGLGKDEAMKTENDNWRSRDEKGKGRKEQRSHGGRESIPQTLNQRRHEYDFNSDANPFIEKKSNSSSEDHNQNLSVKQHSCNRRNNNQPRNQNQSDTLNRNHGPQNILNQIQSQNSSQERNSRPKNDPQIQILNRSRGENINQSRGNKDKHESSHISKPNQSAVNDTPKKTHGKNSRWHESTPSRNASDDIASSANSLTPKTPKVDAIKNNNRFSTPLVNNSRRTPSQLYEPSPTSSSRNRSAVFEE